MYIAPGTYVYAYAHNKYVVVVAVVYTANVIEFQSQSRLYFYATIRGIHIYTAVIQVIRESLVHRHTISNNIDIHNTVYIRTRVLIKRLTRRRQSGIPRYTTSRCRRVSRVSKTTRAREFKRVRHGRRNAVNGYVNSARHVRWHVPASNGKNVRKSRIRTLVEIWWPANRWRTFKLE